MSTLTSFTLLQFASFIVLYLAVGAWKRSRRLPPGPRGLPVFGNIFDLPKGHEWLAYQNWARQYSSSFVTAPCPRVLTPMSV